ncbi:MAG: GtrA family protein [Coriobacteriaceae bacterium]|nr:GtrA family protein [Coriobacteriaceae bacterium]
MMRSNRKIAGEWIRYLLVGFSSAALELVIFFTLFNVMRIDVRIANIIALLCSAIFNYIMSSRWTFKVQGFRARSVVYYLILFVFNQVFSTLVIVWLIDMGWVALVAKIFTMACIVTWNFVLYRSVIFKQDKRSMR